MTEFQPALNSSKIQHRLDREQLLKRINTPKEKTEVYCEWLDETVDIIADCENYNIWGSCPNIEGCAVYRRCKKKLS